MTIKQANCDKGCNMINNKYFNPSLTKLFFNMSNQGGGVVPRFSEPNPYEIYFGINR